MKVEKSNYQLFQESIIETYGKKPNKADYELMIEKKDNVTFYPYGMKRKAEKEKEYTIKTVYPAVYYVPSDFTLTMIMEYVTKHVVTAVSTIYFQSKNPYVYELMKDCLTVLNTRYPDSSYITETLKQIETEFNTAFAQYESYIKKCRIPLLKNQYKASFEKEYSEKRKNGKASYLYKKLKDGKRIRLECNKKQYSDSKAEVKARKRAFKELKNSEIERQEKLINLDGEEIIQETYCFVMELIRYGKIQSFADITAYSYDIFRFVNTYITRQKRQKAKETGEEKLFSNCSIYRFENAVNEKLDKKNDIKIIVSFIVKKCNPKKIDVKLMAEIMILYSYGIKQESIVKKLNGKYNNLNAVTVNRYVKKAFQILTENSSEIFVLLDNSDKPNKVKTA